MFIQPFHLVLSALAHWANREQAAIIDYHSERNHQGLANRLIEATGEAANTTGEIVRESRLGGLLNHYRRAASPRCPRLGTTAARGE